MSIMPPLRPPVPSFNPDGFATTMEAWQFVIQHRCQDASLGKPFLLVTHTIKHRSGDWPILETRVRLGIFVRTHPLFTVVADRLWVAASHHMQMACGTTVLEGGFVIEYRNFERTPLKESFVPPVTVGTCFEPGQTVRAFTLSVGLESVEAAVFAERGSLHFDAWYLRAARALGLPLLATGLMQEALARRSVETLATLLTLRNQDPALVREEIRRRIAYARELGLDKEHRFLLVNGIDYMPSRLIGNLEQLYPES